MKSILTAVQNLPWLELIIGALLSAIVGFLVWLITRIYELYIANRDLPYRISGTWFSAEYDPKIAKERAQRNTFTQLKIRRGLGGRFIVRVVKQFGNTKSGPETAWKLTGRIYNGDTLVGVWKSTVKNTKRFGTAVLKFTDYGRGVGYWIGPTGKDYPVYGYWIMTREEQHTRFLVQRILDVSRFECEDIVGLIINEPPFNVNGTINPQ